MGCVSASLRSHLPIAGATEYAKGQVIYSPDNPTTCIYLVVKGAVEISQLIEGNCGMLLEIARPDELFGESAFLTVPNRRERATVLENATLMTWPMSEMEDLIMQRPELGIALLQFFVQRSADISRRIESLSLDTIEHRLARSLIRFSERLGTPEGEGSIRVMPLTHEMLARYIGASGEIIAQCMDRFRQQGYVSYSQRGIVLNHDPFQKLYSNPPQMQRLRKRTPRRDRVRP